MLKKRYQVRIERTNGTATKLVTQPTDCTAREVKRKYANIFHTHNIEVRRVS